MNNIFRYIRRYLSAASVPVHALSVTFLSVLVFCNYAFHLNRNIYLLPGPLPFVGWYLLLLVVFLFPYALYQLLVPGGLKWNRRFGAMVLLAPFVFAWKMTAPVKFFPPEPPYHFWNAFSYFIIKAVVVTGMLLMLRRVGGKDAAWMGLRSQWRNMAPYLLMLLIMTPLVAAAATQPDFLQVYPKVGHMLHKADVNNMAKVLLFETAYGIDFFTIELFFRGFLVIYLARWAGTQSILPMAVFYCVIHFGKPLGECISSFFGGMLLGIVSYNTRSIWGGLAVHLGIAWLMELAGGIANSMAP